MDVMNLLAGGSSIGNVAQIQNNKSSVESADFSKQLFSVVKSDLEMTDANASQVALATVSVSENPANVENIQLTADQLNEWLENLISELEQIENLELDHSLTEQLASILDQVNALIYIVSPHSNNSNATSQEIAMQLNTLHTNQPALNNNVIVKLQDQLLELQQLLQDQSSKLLHGKSIEKIVAEQVPAIQSKVEQLLKDAKSKLTTSFADEAQLQSKFVASDSGNQSTGLISKLNQQSSFVEIALQSASVNAKAENVTASVEPTNNTLNAVPISMLRTDSVKESLTQLTNGTSTSTSSYVLVDEFADTMRSMIVNRFSVTTLNGVSEARLALTPDHLGHVDVKISMQNGMLTAVFQTETAMAKDALENQMIQLRASLASQGITVEKIEVSQSSQSSLLSQDQQSSSQHQERNNGNNKSRSFNEALEDELIINSVKQDLGFGRAVNEIV